MKYLCEVGSFNPCLVFYTAETRSGSWEKCLLACFFTLHWAISSESKKETNSSNVSQMSDILIINH